MPKVMERLRICVLMGGDSAEREVSLNSGKAVAKALLARGHEVLAIDLSYQFSHQPSAISHQPLAPSAISCSPQDLFEEFRLFRPDVVFPLLHGGYGEDGTLQGFLELLSLPYTCSPPAACALAMDKRLTKRLLYLEDILTPEHIDVHEGIDPDDVTRFVQTRIGFPCVVKPARLGSTIGVSIVEDAHALPDALELAFSHDPFALVEVKIDGTEISVPVLGGGEEAQPLPVIEIVPKMAGFYNYESKYAPGGSDHIIPPRLPEELQQRAKELAVRVHNLLGCRGVTRTDMMVDKAGRIYVLELNAIPGMTSTSLVPDAARAVGISFEELCERLVWMALCQKVRKPEWQSV